MWPGTQAKTMEEVLEWGEIGLRGECVGLGGWLNRDLEGRKGSLKGGGIC